MRKKLIFGIAASLICAAPLALAQDDDSTTTSDEYPGDWDHAKNRSIAFGSVLMGAQGADVTTWKAVESWTLCDAPPPLPENPTPGAIPDPGDPDDPTGNEDSDNRDNRDNPTSNRTNDCFNEVLYTTHYELVECPDGRAYIARSGEGISMTSKTEGERFNWAKMPGCGGETNGSWPENMMSKNRPLVRSKLIKN